MSTETGKLCDAVEEYIDLELPALHEYFLNRIYTCPERGEVFLRNLKSEERYGIDPAFKLTVEVFEYVLGVHYTYPFRPGKTEQELNVCLDMMSRAKKLELWFLVSHLWLFLGVAYTCLNMLEKAVECYSRLIEIDKRYNLYSLTHVAYYNLAMVYNTVDYYEKVKVCLLKSNAELQLHPPEAKRYEEKLFLNYIYLLLTYSIEENLEKATEIHEKLRSFDKKNQKFHVVYLYTIFNLMYMFLRYANQLCGFEEVKLCFEEGLKLVPSDNAWYYYWLLLQYVSRCFHYEIKLALFEDRVLEAASYYPTDIPLANFSILEIIVNYYGVKKGEIKLDSPYKDFTKETSRIIKEYRQNQSNALNIVETLMRRHPEKEEMSSENLELKLLYHESVEAKRKLSEAYERIELIGQLGRKLTSMTNLEELIQSFNDILKHHVEFDAFTLFMTDKDRGVLRSLVFNFNGVLQPTLEISLDAEDSLNAKCYRMRKVCNVETGSDQNLKFLNIEDSDLCMRSAVYLPLVVNQNVIGVYTLQHRGKNVYNDKLEFLEDLSPYMSIALNNAIRSWTLEKEIESHIVTQNKLKEANYNLEKLSLVDSLTHISSRRYFEKKILDMLKDSEEKQATLTMLMIDIDDFKIYNDTYGHLEGDKALQAVASVFRREMEKVGGLSARFGGEEFVGACFNLSLEESAELGEAIRQGVFDLKMENRRTECGRLTVSIGLAFGIGLTRNDKSAMMRTADNMLYKAKSRGKNKMMIQYCDSCFK